MALMLAALPASADVPPDAEILVLGEVHDNPAHHAEQARLVALVRPTAIVWEMLSDAQIARARSVDMSNIEQLDAALGWTASGWPDLAMYHPIFMAGGDAAHLGAAVSRDSLRRAMASGAASRMGSRADEFGLFPLAPMEQAAREAEQASAHCDALPVDLLPGMVEAQRLRDAQMAMRALDALRSFGAPVVVITGNGHARLDVGVPALLTVAEPAVRVWSLGQLEGDTPGDAPFDAVRVTDRVARDDPCAVFRSPSAPGRSAQGG